MNNNLKGVLFALIGFTSYSCMDATIKFVVMFNNISWQVLIFYVSIVILFILFLTILLSQNTTFKVKRPLWLFIRAFIGVFNLHIVFFILPQVNLGLFYSLVFVSPIIATILASFILGEHINVHKLICIITGFLGILIITKPWEYFTHGTFSAIELVPLLVALSDAAIGIIARKYLINDKSTTLVFYQFILCTIVSGLIVLYNQKLTLDHEFKISFILSIGLTAIFALGGYIFYIIAVQKAPIQIVLPMGYSQMAFGVMISIIIFAQYPTYNILIGSLIIVLSSLYMILYAAKNKPKKYVCK